MSGVLTMVRSNIHIECLVELQSVSPQCDGAFHDEFALNEGMRFRSLCVFPCFVCPREGTTGAREGHSRVHDGTAGAREGTAGAAPGMFGHSHNGVEGVREHGG